jgi:RNA-directed DNA polymerase
MAGSGGGGYFRYFAVPGNFRALASFRTQTAHLWLQELSRRSQRRGLSWTVFGPRVNQLLPHPLILHPYPDERFHAKHPT